MNVFEDLVVELQQENLLEIPGVESPQEQFVDTSHLEETVVPNVSCDLPQYGEAVESAPVDEPEQSFAAQPSYQEEPQVEYEHEDMSEPEEDMSIHETIAAPEAATVSPEPEPVIEDAPPSKRADNGREFFKKRAMGEVSSLQMVEHVVTGVEREYMKVVPKPFDDFNAKKALHTFLHSEEELHSEAHASAEYTLMHETEAWCSALSERDRNIPVSSLRQYCERSRPALSSQAMLGLARFYRNLPYSEGVRSKFDFVITRLFSRAAAQEKRVCLFTRDETLKHINTLYSDWSSIALYRADDEEADESKILLTALSFEDLAIESEQASTFDQLIESDFFGRLRMFKESISELFYAPQVTAAAIEGNIRIGNAYVELIDRERRKLDAESVRNKYGDLNDHAISEATGQSLQLQDLLRELSVQAEPAIDDPTGQQFDYSFDQEPETAIEAETKAEETATKYKSPLVARILNNAFSVNKWFLAVAILLIGASIGLYVWANYMTTDRISTAGVQVVEVENSVLKQYIKTARISGETFYGQMLPLWDRLPKEKREEFLQVVLKAAQEKGCKQVDLITKDGKPAGYASATRLEVPMP